MRPSDEDEAVYFAEPPLVYANRTYWYPRPPGEEFTTSTLRFDVPEGWLAVTGGEQREALTEDRRTRSEYRLEQPGKFVTAIVGRLSDVGRRQLDAQAVRGYATARTRSQTLAGMAKAEEMLTFYARLFGPCPYPSLGLVVAEARTPGGHSPPGLVYVQERPPMMRPLAEDPSNFSDIPGYFLAHELAHQWWGQGTAPATYRERWLSEAWAQYAAALWVREKLGEDDFRRMMDRMARWAFRLDAEGPIHLGQRLGLLRRDPRIFRAIVYDKGAWVLHMLRGIVGDEAFFAGAKRFLEHRRFSLATTADLRAALEAASGRDLRPYFTHWIEDTGLPRLRWRAATEPAAGGFRTTVSVQAEGLPGPVPLLVTLSGAGGREERVQLPPEGGSWSFETAGRPRVTLNEDRGLLARVERGGGRR
jgi:aminopeptidase N